jgi:hypothetical protein
LTAVCFRFDGCFRGCFRGYFCGCFVAIESLENALRHNPPELLLQKSHACPATALGPSFSLALDRKDPNMRFTKEEGHFTTREQALAEIASLGWHGILALPLHPFDLTQPVDKPLAGRP